MQLAIQERDTDFPARSRETRLHTVREVQAVKSGMRNVGVVPLLSG